MLKFTQKLLVFTGYVLAVVIDATIDTIGILAIVTLLVFVTMFLKSMLQSPAPQYEKLHSNDIILARYIENLHRTTDKEEKVDEKEKSDGTLSGGDTVEVSGTVIEVGSGIPQF